MKTLLDRRHLLKLAAFASASLASRPLLAATPACHDNDEPTPSETEGPYFTPGSPQRSSLVEPGDNAPRMRLTGRVLSRRCEPLSAALLDFWHSDAIGKYDLRGFRHRGHLFANADGQFELLTDIPGLYPGRTRHIHVRVQRPNGPILTTQLYFPDEPRNRRDGLFDERLVMKAEKAGTFLEARFDFVVS